MLLGISISGDWGLLVSGDARGDSVSVWYPGPLRLHFCPQHPGKPAAEEQPERTTRSHHDEHAGISGSITLPQCPNVFRMSTASDCDLLCFKEQRCSASFTCSLKVEVTRSLCWVLHPKDCFWMCLLVTAFPGFYFYPPLEPQTPMSNISVDAAP